MEDDGTTFFSQISFALVYVKIYQFNTYKKFRRVTSIVSWMVHYPAAILMFLLRSHTLHTQKLHNFKPLQIFLILIMTLNFFSHHCFLSISVSLSFCKECKKKTTVLCLRKTNHSPTSLSIFYWFIFRWKRMERRNRDTSVFEVDKIPWPESMC